MGLSSLGQFETEEKRQQMLKALVQPAIETRLFKEVDSRQITVDIRYTAEDYLLLLSSYSPYLSLEESRRNNLFEMLRRKINDDLMGTIELSYISAVNIFKKMTG
jgi:hypothetical protein